MGTIKPSVRYTLIHNDRSQGRYQECGYVRGHANRCCRMRHSGTREIQPNMALHCRTQLWIVRHPRDKTLYLLLSWTGRHSPLQVWIEQSTNGQSRATISLQYSNIK